MTNIEISGRIQDFPLAEVLRHISLTRRSGTLHLRNSRHNGQIEFREGSILRARTSTGYRDIGTLLLRNGALSHAQFEQALLGRDGPAQKTLLGKALIALGLVTPRDVRAAMREQVEEVLTDLLGWGSGSFAFQCAPPCREDDIAQDVSEVLLEANLLSALLENRRSKSGQGGPGVALDEPDPAWSPAAARCTCNGEDAFRSGGRVVEATNEDDAAGNWAVLRQGLKEFRAAPSRDDMITPLFHILSGYLARCILFETEGEEYRVVDAIGAYPRGRVIRDLRRKISLVHHRAPAVRRCVESLEPYRGPIVPEDWPRGFFKVIGHPANGEVLILPTGGGEGSVAFIYGDNGDSARTLPAVEFLGILALGMGIHMENRTLRLRLEEAQRRVG